MPNGAPPGFHLVIEATGEWQLSRKFQKRLAAASKYHKLSRKPDPIAVPDCRAGGVVLFQRNSMGICRCWRHEGVGQLQRAHLIAD